MICRSLLQIKVITNKTREPHSRNATSSLRSLWLYNQYWARYWARLFACKRKFLGLNFSLDMYSRGVIKKEMLRKEVDVNVDNENEEMTKEVNDNVEVGRLRCRNNLKWSIEMAQKWDNDEKKPRWKCRCWKEKMTNEVNHTVKLCRVRCLNTVNRQF